MCGGGLSFAHLSLGASAAACTGLAVLYVLLINVLSRGYARCVCS